MKIPRAACEKLHEMQFLCIAKRVAVNSDDRITDDDRREIIILLSVQDDDKIVSMKVQELCDRPIGIRKGVRQDGKISES